MIRNSIGLQNFAKPTFGKVSFQKVGKGMLIQDPDENLNVFYTNIQDITGLKKSSEGHNTITMHSSKESEMPKIELIGRFSEIVAEYNKAFL